MKQAWIAGLLLFSAATTAAQTKESILDPARAIAAADASRTGYHGRFAMTVLSTGTSRTATYLNATADYRAPDALTFRLAPNVAAAMEKRYGAPADQYLKGKRVTVEGIVQRRMIVNSRYGKAESFNRWTHEVYVRLPGQIIAVE
ncbi:hypothetical protein JW805_14575 [Roseomonas aeriglobus]|nr:hypothetical protein [Roseomonas aeriglobus]